MLGKVLQAVSRYSGTSTVGLEAVGQTVISVDSVRDFVLDSGFVMLKEEVRGYVSVDRVNSTITLASALTVAAQPGTDLRIFPLSVQRWVLVEEVNGDTPVDASWAVVPHALSAFIDADGVRTEDTQETVECERQTNGEMLVLDVKNKTPFLNPSAIPDGAITETKVSPGSITTPLLAANAVAAQNLQFGAATGDKISSNAIDGKTITGALVRSAASGNRVELSTQGLKQFKLIGGVEAETLSIGDQNRFTGEVDAVAMIIRDAMQMFGRNNYMSAGSKMTLSTGPAASTASPTLAWVYDPGPASDSGWFGTGGHSEPGAAKSDNTAIFFENSEYIRADGKRWTFPQITRPDGSVGCEFKPQTMVRIAKLDTGAERVVMIGEDYNSYSGGYPKIFLRVYDDSTMLTNGTVAPVLKQQVEVDTFSFFKSYRLGRIVTGGARNQFLIAKTTAPLGGGAKNLTFSGWAWLNNDAEIFLNYSYDLGAILADNESLAGCAYGPKSALGIAGTGSDIVFVGLTSVQNFVYNATASAMEPSSYFPTTYNSQDVAWSEGSVSANTHTCFVSHNFAAGTDMKRYRYANNHKQAVETWWANFVWRGEATKTFRTTMSASASTPYRKMAKLRVTMPSLPAPIAGVGVARDPNNDVYGWEYFIGVGSSEPVRTGMWLQSNQPNMVAGTALAVNSVDLGTYPVQSGTNPPASNTFPAVSPASIENGSGTLKINGDADIWARNLFLSSDTAWAAPSLSNSWANLGGTWEAAGYRRYHGFVVLRGLLSGGTVTDNTLLFTLPVGFRPATDKHFSVAGSGSAGVPIVKVLANGNVTTGQNVTSSYLSLAGITFIAEQ